MLPLLVAATSDLPAASRLSKSCHPAGLGVFRMTCAALAVEPCRVLSSSSTTTARPALRMPARAGRRGRQPFQNASAVPSRLGSRHIGCGMLTGGNPFEGVKRVLDCRAAIKDEHCAIKPGQVCEQRRTTSASVSSGCQCFGAGLAHGRAVHSQGQTSGGDGLARPSLALPPVATRNGLVLTL